VFNIIAAEGLPCTDTLKQELLRMLA